MDATTIERELEAKTITPEAALAALAEAVRHAPTSARRLEACVVLGSLAGRALGASWDVAERAAFVLLEVARETDAAGERARLLGAMGRGLRNAWLVPYVHARLDDEDPLVAAAAIAAAGGLAFPALEAAVARFLSPETPAPLRLAALTALGRMGAQSAAEAIASHVAGGAREATAALAALTEIRARAAEEGALARLAGTPDRAVRLAAVRYLAELGRPEVLPYLRRLAREDDAHLRLAASFASRAYRDETRTGADERMLAALTETDRAVRASLARRLRTLPVAEVLEHAELLFADEPEGVVQILAEVRASEVTERLLAIAHDESLPANVRARAAGSIEADLEWEREALLALVREAGEEPVRVAAAQTLGAFASASAILEHLGPLAEDPSPALRGALLWALQLAARPKDLTPADRTRTDAILRRALGDEDASVRRRAAYVAGNLHAEGLVPALVELARGATEAPTERVAAFVGLAEIGSPDRLADLVHLVNREDDPAALGAAARAIEKSTLGGSRDPLERLADRVPKLLRSEDPLVRAAGARVAGLTSGVGIEHVAPLVEDAAPRVREQAVGAIGRMGGDEAEGLLRAALDDADAVVQERAAEGLLALRAASATRSVLDWFARSDDGPLVDRLAARIELPPEADDALVEALDAAIGHVSPDRVAYERLLELKIRALTGQRPSRAGGVDVDRAISAQFPTWARLSTVRGFSPLARSLRTAELLYEMTASDADQSGAIVLFSKSLEGYLHAWLSPRLAELVRRPSELQEVTDRMTGSAWPSYQRWLAKRWKDAAVVGGLEVQLPLRAAIHALRDLGDGRKHFDSPRSITEWARMMLFLALDHPTGPKNLLGVTSSDAEHIVRVAHRLQVLAHVRNAVTHRTVAGRPVVEGFRGVYYPTFEDLTSMA
ncbi:MAG: HEAT repeat domain-containing protein [Sandaracinaceae bacterium]|nr:HEAT repeat domain-containing protein [Sandaracinaceae bacterium]